MKEFKDYYGILGVRCNAKPEEIQAGWRAKLKELRPDINTDLETRAKFDKIQEAHKVLMNPFEKSLYDISYDFQKLLIAGQFCVKGMNDAVKEAEDNIRRMQDMYHS